MYQYVQHSEAKQQIIHIHIILSTYDFLFLYTCIHIYVYMCVYEVIMLMFTIKESYVKDTRVHPKTTPENPVDRQPYAFLTGTFLSPIFFFFNVTFCFLTCSLP